MHRLAHNQFDSPEDDAGGDTSPRAHSPRRSLSLDGILVAGAELERRPMTYQPLDQVWLFRQEQTWSVMTLRRAETWSDDGVAAPVSGTAAVVIEEADCLDALSEMVQARYATTGWVSLLDAGHDAELFGPGCPARSRQTSMRRCSSGPIGRGRLAPSPPGRPAASGPRSKATSSAPASR